MMVLVRRLLRNISGVVLFAIDPKATSMHSHQQFVKYINISWISDIR